MTPKAIFSVSTRVNENIEQVFAALLGRRAHLFIHSANADNSQLILDFLDAHNRHDVDEVISFLAEDGRWMRIDEAMPVTGASDREHLAAGLSAYSASQPSVRSFDRDPQTNGKFVSVVEEVQWTGDGNNRQQCALAIYEIDDGAIRRVWYFATQSCAATP